MKKTVIAFVLIHLFVFPLYSQDWSNLKRYQPDNDTLLSRPAPRDRVVFMGNSITDMWIRSSPSFFTDNQYVDRGISGQTSPQMLLRFRADVIQLKPAAVVIECGTNDIAGNTGPSTLKMIEDNIQSMCELAVANKIRVILGSVLPANKFGWAPLVQPADSIIELNKWISLYARQHHFGYVDYYSSLVDENKGMKAGYSGDGVHPNKEGYTVMENLVQPVVKRMIGQKK